ncbi:MAG TPA: hypothetical protein VFV73_42860 [Streptosporangiaceae bacterium]|nr:hypothetical protein [Streptosporangiaceae bacterium]
MPSPAVVQAALAGQGWHWALVKRATMSGPASGEDVGEVSRPAGDLPRRE